MKAIAGGCASKLNPSILDRALRAVPRVTNPHVLVGYDTVDDAGVYDISQPGAEPLAMVQTVDFFPPMVDDPFQFGGIAAANALSDVYAMGGRPVSALALVAFPGNGNVAELEAILQGGAEKIHEAGAVILGGHSISDDAIKFGYAVTGLIDPQNILTNAGARPGDALVFTKRIGTGVITTAFRQESAEQGDVDDAIAQMLTLNRNACLAMLKRQVHACTDVTGFGLLGHAREMALASNVTLEIAASAVQYLPGAVGYARAKAFSTGLKNNREFVESCVSMPQAIPPEIQALLYDPQTSGGLLISLEPDQAASLISDVPDAYIIGSVAERSTKPLVVQL